MNYGMKVKLRFNVKSPFKGTISVYRNVTEIHYNFVDGKLFEDELTPEQIRFRIAMGGKVAFESDIHSTGCVHPLQHIDEFETELEKKKQKSF